MHQSRGKLRTVIAVSVVALNVAAAAYAQTRSPFTRLAGQWSGSGTINFANNQHEPIKCRAAYDVLEEQRNLQLDIRCASESYRFDLRGTATENGGHITGYWSESTRNANGTLSGKADSSHVQVIAQGPSFSATLTFVTRGDKQTVSIKAQDINASIQGATINLRRS